MKFKVSNEYSLAITLTLGTMGGTRPSGLFGSVSECRSAGRIVSGVETGAGSEADVAVLGYDAQEDSELCS